MGQTGHLLNPSAKVQQKINSAKFFKKFFEKFLINIFSADYQIFRR